MEDDIVDVMDVLSAMAECVVESDAFFNVPIVPDPVVNHKFGNVKTYNKFLQQ
jgi:hypothetical protein